MALVLGGVTPSFVTEGEENISAPYVANELIVKFQDGVSEEKVTEINSSLGTEIVVHTSGGEYLLHITNDKSVPEVISSYTALPEVEYAQPNWILTIR